MKESILTLTESDQEPNLGLRNDFNSYFLSLQASFFTFGRASIPKMPSTHLAINLVVRSKVFREAETLIKTDLELLAFGDRDPVGLVGGAVATREESAYVLSRGRRRERSLEDAQRRRARARRRGFE